MSEVDWSKAPKGTTGAMVANWPHPCGKGHVEFIPAQGERGRYAEGPGSWMYYPLPMSWGEEDMPPVGTVCELRSSQKLTDGTRLEEFPVGTKVLVGGHANFGGCDVAVVNVKGRHFCGTMIPSQLRPIRTAEQIAADERLHKIRNALTSISRGIEQYNTTVDASAAIRATVEAMIDAGYSK